MQDFCHELHAVVGGKAQQESVTTKKRGAISVSGMIRIGIYVTCQKSDQRHMVRGGEAFCAVSLVLPST